MTNLDGRFSEPYLTSTLAAAGKSAFKHHFGSGARVFITLVRHADSRAGLDLVLLNLLPLLVHVHDLFSQGEAHRISGFSLDGNRLRRHRCYQTGSRPSRVTAAGRRRD